MIPAVNGNRRARIVIVTSEIALIAGLLLVWILSPAIRESRELAVLFFYSFPSEFLVGLVPHEPVLIYFGEFYTPLTVMLVAGIGTVLAEWVNYTVFHFFTSTVVYQRMAEKGGVQRIIRLFRRAPFAAIWIAGFTPVPFYPLRFLAVMGHYPVARYLLAVFLSRAPRFFILALVGYKFNISPIWLMILFLVILGLLNVPLLMNLIRNALRKRRE